MDNGLDLRGWHGFEEPLQNQEIDHLVAQRKDNVISESIPGPVAPIKDSPAPFLSMAAANMLP
jgi:hypothetical protein